MNPTAHFTKLKYSLNVLPFQAIINLCVEHWESMMMHNAFLSSAIADLKCNFSANELEFAFSAQAYENRSVSPIAWSVGMTLTSDDEVEDTCISLNSFWRLCVSCMYNIFKVFP
jgi:hypothetical protein